MGELAFPNGRILEYSRGLKCELSDSGDKLIINILSENGITFATRNMQEDYADFEAIAFSAWSICPDCYIILKYDSFEWDESSKNWKNALDFTLTNRRKASKKIIPSEICHYSRFLYRVYMMMCLYDGFNVDFQNVSEVRYFGKIYSNAMKNGDLIFNVPKSKSNINEMESTGAITENQLEKWFVANTSNKFKTKTHIIVEKCGNIELHDQLPCGMFYRKVSEEARIFNTGYFDLWAACENTIYLFELKKEGNEKLGIISELFFYSCLINDFVKIIKKQYDRYNNDVYERGFNDFIRVTNAETVKIKAFFLAPAFHSFFDPKSLSGELRKNKRDENMKALLNAMNKRTDNVSFDYIVFDQREIVGNDPKKFVDALLSSWK